MDLVRNILVRYLIVCLFLLCVSPNTSFSQQLSDSTSQSLTPRKFYPGRFAFVSSSAVVAGIVTYIYVQNVWWTNQKTSFHIDHDLDYRYAKNLDKGAHFIGGMMSAELFKAGFYWSGLQQERSYIYAFILGSMMQGIIEIKDGFAPTYGFSVGDVAAGTIGSFVPYIKYKFPKLHALHVKVSYYRHNDYYYQMSAKADLIDDYMNQTYWLSLSVNDWLPKGSKAEKIWPDFLCIVGGWGVDETLNDYYTGQNLAENKGKGNYEFYVSIDIDWRKIISQKHRFLKALSSSLNYVKLPLPTLRLLPAAKYYWGFL